MRVSPLGRITLSVTFGGRANFRTETLDFEVIDLPGAYQAILGRPCYAKFMDVPNYAYLKLKLLGPQGVITVGGDQHRAHSCEEENLKIVVTAVRAL